MAILMSFTICIMSGESIAVSVKAEPMSGISNNTLIRVTDKKTEEEKFVIKLIEKEKINEVPLYIQQDYPDTSYGEYGTVLSHGCGIACLAMVATYLTDRIYKPDELAIKYSDYNTENGSKWILFEDSAEELNLSLQGRTNSKKQVIKALKNGQVVISLQSEGLFTDTGHFIVLESISPDGKIFVKDPNIKNYDKNKTLIRGFKNGFAERQIFENGGPYWIYDKKI